MGEQIIDVEKELYRALEQLVNSIEENEKAIQEAEAAKDEAGTNLNKHIRETGKLLGLRCIQKVYDENIQALEDKLKSDANEHIQNYKQLIKKYGIDEEALDQLNSFYSLTFMLCQDVASGLREMIGKAKHSFSMIKTTELRVYEIAESIIQALEKDDKVNVLTLKRAYSIIFDQYEAAFGFMLGDVIGTKHDLIIQTCSLFYEKGQLSGNREEALQYAREQFKDIKKPAF